MDVASWTHKQYSPFLAILCIKTSLYNITVINLYNPTRSGPQIAIWNTLSQALTEAQGEILLLGDFNVHHPIWGGPQAACDPQAEHLLLEAQARSLQLLTPPGEPTWKRGAQETVIDLTFASESL
jgi:hypothetical protein